MRASKTTKKHRFKLVSSIVYEIDGGLTSVHISRSGDIANKIYNVVVEDLFFKEFKRITEQEIKSTYGIALPTGFRFETVFPKASKMSKANSMRRTQRVQRDGIKRLFR
jgi:hypothetical protein